MRTPTVASQPSGGNISGITAETARDTLTAFVKGAKHQLLIYDVNIQDTEFIKLLKQQAASGVDVRVIGKFKAAGDTIAVRSQGRHHQAAGAAVVAEFVPPKSRRLA